MGAPGNLKPSIAALRASSTVDAGPTYHPSGAAGAIGILGDAWIVRILRTSFRGERRFSGFLRELAVSRTVLVDRLQRMCSHGLLAKVETAGSHPQYLLTEQGLDLWGVMLGMWQWESHFGSGIDPQALAHDKPRAVLVHAVCGHRMDPVYACAHCQAPVSPFETFAVPAPHAQPARSEAAEPPDEQPRSQRYRQSQSDDRDRLPALLRVFGDRWNAALMAAAFQGCKTFTDLSAATGIRPALLSARLDELQELGMFRARAYAGSRQEYRLTRQAVATYPVTLELIRWGDRWLHQGHGPLEVFHRTCGHRLQARWTCPVCHAALQRESLRFEA